MRILLYLAFNIFIFTSLFSNTGVFENSPVSGTLFPINNTNIQLISEIVIYSNNHFNTSFIFSNTSEMTQKLLLGFPLFGKYERIDANMDIITNKKQIIESMNQYFDYNVYINGKRVNTKLNFNNNTNNTRYYNFIYSWNTVFLPKQVLFISNHYNQNIDKDSYGAHGEGTASIDYFTITGSQWKSSINKADFIFYSPIAFDLNRYEIYSTCFIFTYLKCYPTNNIVTNYNKIISNYAIEYHFINYKPTNNIKVVWFRDSISLYEINEYSTNIDSNFIIKMQDKDQFYRCIVSLSQNYYFTPEKDGSFCNFLINSIYALYNYNFKNIKIRNFFKQFSWYKPLTDKPELSKEDKELQSYILKLKEKATYTNN